MSTTSEPTVKVPFFKKGKSRPATARKRSASPSAEKANPGPSSSGHSTSKSQVVLPTKKATPNLLSAGTKRTVSQRTDDYDDGEDHDAEPRRDTLEVKWTAKGSNRDYALDILAGDEAEELMAKRAKTDKKDDSDEDIPDDGQYHGQKAYKSHLKRNKEVPKAMRVGPQRSSGSTIRTVTIVDYQPDVCKDYKETGYCGFGDTCKFLHDRGTYLAGWQLDKLAENPRKQVGDDASDSDSDSDDEDIPFACLICRKPFTDPIVTRCGHYFDSACAIKRFAKTPKCLACGAPTGGIFNRADKILAKIEKRRQEKESGHDKEDGGEDGNEHGGRGPQIEGLKGNSDEASSGSGDDDSDED